VCGQQQQLQGLAAQQAVGVAQQAHKAPASNKQKRPVQAFSDSVSMALPLVGIRLSIVSVGSLEQLTLQYQLADAAANNRKTPSDTALP
jgi:hypothetical protein